MSILFTCAAHRNLCGFINITILFSIIRISNSSFVFTLRVPSLSNVGPCIFLTTLLSKTSRRFCSVIVIAHVSQPYVTVGRMIDLYICTYCNKVTNGCNCLFCFVFISFIFTLHVSGSHKPIIRGVSSCFFYIQPNGCIQKTA